jgi:hypothetical protein
VGAGGVEVPVPPPANLLAVRIVRPAGAEEFVVGGLASDLARRCPRAGGRDEPDNRADDQEDSEDGADERPAEGEAQPDEHRGSEPDDDDRGHPLNVPPRFGLQTGRFWVQGTPPYVLADLLSRRGLERPCETLVAWAREA